MKKRKLGLLGSGFLSGIIAEAMHNGLLPEYELVGIAGRNPVTTQEMAQKYGCKACLSSDELLSLRPDYIAEAASGAAVREIAVKALSAGSNLIVLSIGAFADTDFYEQVKKTAAAHGTRVYIASGAVGGFDVLRTVSLMGKAVSGIETHKGPASLQGTPLFSEQLDTQETEVFAGSAKDAIALLPTKVNVAVAASLATTGPENTEVHITSDTSGFYTKLLPKSKACGQS